MKELSPKQAEVFNLYAQGYSAKEIAIKLGIAYHTVAEHTQAALRKQGLSHRGQLVARMNGKFYGDVQ